MRKSQKNQILSVVGLLDKAHGAFRKAMETGNADGALTLMEQCQDSAIQILLFVDFSAKTIYFICVMYISIFFCVKYCTVESKL